MKLGEIKLVKNGYVYVPNNSNPTKVFSRFSELTTYLHTIYFPESSTDES